MAGEGALADLVSTHSYSLAESVRPRMHTDLHNELVNIFGPRNSELWAPFSSSLVPQEQGEMFSVFAAANQSSLFSAFLHKTLVTRISKDIAVTAGIKTPQAGFRYLSHERARLLLAELERSQAELDTGGSNAEEATSAGCQVLRTIENILREVCFTNGGVVVQKVKNGVTTAMKLRGIRAYILECKAIKAHLSIPVINRLLKAKDDRDRFSAEPGLLMRASKGLEFCALGFELLEEVTT
jgi:hypothetical protein